MKRFPKLVSIFAVLRLTSHWKNYVFLNFLIDVSFISICIICYTSDFSWRDLWYQLISFSLNFAWFARMKLLLWASLIDASVVCNFIFQTKLNKLFFYSVRSYYSSIIILITKFHNFKTLIFCLNDHVPKNISLYFNMG